MSEGPHSPNAPEPMPNSPNWTDIPWREVKEYEWQFDENGQVIFPIDFPQPEFNPDETQPRKQDKPGSYYSRLKELLILYIALYLK